MSRLRIVRSKACRACYVDNLVLRNCRLINTTLAFEYSSVDADVHGAIDSVFNPASGAIRADAIGELTLDPERIDPSATTVITADVTER